MNDIPLTERLAGLKEARLLSYLLATETQAQPENHVFAVLNFVAFDLIARFSLLGGGHSNG